MKIPFVLLTALFLAGCAAHTYSPKDFINPNRVVTRQVSVSVPKPKIRAAFGYGNNPAVVKAYNQFTKSGLAKNIAAGGFQTFAYDAYAHPIVECAPLHLCVIQLERGEQINNIDLGDAAHWLISTALVGSEKDSSYQIAVKPKLYDTATDMVITTNRRSYSIGLVSKKGARTHIINFYYPEDTLDQAVQKLQQAEGSLEAAPVATAVDLNQLNFNYSLSGDYPGWRPSKVFDDGVKTFIQMPPITDRTDLPVLYILRDKQQQLVNYRYKRPYYIVDGLFKTGYLISGKGHTQVRVIICNHNF